MQLSLSLLWLISDLIGHQLLLPYGMRLVPCPSSGSISARAINVVFDRLYGAGPDDAREC